MSLSKARFDELPAILRSLARCYGKTTQTAYLVTSGSLEATAKADPNAFTWRNDWRITCQQYLSKLHTQQFLQIDYYNIQTSYKRHAFYALILLSLTFNVPLCQLPIGLMLLIFPLCLQFKQKHTCQSAYWLLACVEILSFGYNWYFALWYNSLLILLCSYNWLLYHFKTRYTALSIAGQQYYQNLQHDLYMIKQQNEPCVTYERFDQQSQQLQASFTQSLKYITHN